MSQRIILKGKSELLKPVIMQILAMHQLLENLDIGSDAPEKESFDPGRRYHPLVRLYFMQDSDFKPGTNQPAGRGQRRKKGELRFRLMDETIDTISEANLKALGERIKQTFGGNSRYIWSKGKELYCYADWSRGYQLQILARSQAQVEDLVQKILSLQNHTPTWRYLSKIKNTREAERYPNVLETKTILGEQATLPLKRPNVNVRFRFADVRISPLSRPIVIYDATGRRVGALVR